MMEWEQISDEKKMEVKITNEEPTKIDEKNPLDLKKMLGPLSRSLSDIKTNVVEHFDKASTGVQRSLENTGKEASKMPEKLHAAVTAPPPPVVNSFWKNLFNFLSGSKSGDVWDSTKAFRAYHQGKLASRDPSSQHLRVAFRNLTDSPLVVCWINYEGEPEMYIELSPQPIAGNPLTANNITPLDVVQNVTLGDTFCFLQCEDPEEAEKEQDFDDMIGAYRPVSLGVSEAEEEAMIHLVTIEEKHAWLFKKCKPDPDSLPDERDTDVKHYTLHSRVVMLDMKPMDSSKKVYEKITLGDWPVMAEEDWNGGDDALLQRIEADITAAVAALPEFAREKLKENTPIYLNKNISYGPKSCPIAGSGIRYHGDKSWLEDMGMSIEKTGSIEVFEASEYFHDCDDWGEGGVFLRLFCMAFHDKVIGFDNDEIDRCYKKAMKECLYDNVVVRTDGIETQSKAYAALSPSAYFSELSTAFLGGLDKEKKFNKWEPFNREGVKQWDYRAFKLLGKLWQVSVEEKVLIGVTKPTSSRRLMAAGTRKKKPNSMKISMDEPTHSLGSA